MKPSQRRLDAQVCALWCLCAIAALLAGVADQARAEAAPGGTIPAVVARGRGFVAGMLDPSLGLVPEYRGATVYWLFHDNYLAAKVLAQSHPAVASTIRSALRREGVGASGKIELLFNEPPDPLPFRQYELRDVRQDGARRIRTEVATSKPLAGWAHYADLLLMASIAEKAPAQARRHWDDAIRMWDGVGFMDAATRSAHRYATYKLALALLAAHHQHPPVTCPSGLEGRLLSLQQSSGGWVTDYDAKGTPVGLANVETTCLAILGLEAASGAPDTKHQQHKALDETHR